VHAFSGQSVVLLAQVSSPGACQLTWERAQDWNVWTGLGDGARFSGTRTPVLSLSGARQSDCSRYRLRVRQQGACADVLSDEIALVVCASPDFNHDGDVATDADIEAFFACLAGNCCPACDSADVNSDGDVATDRDIEAFFSLLAGNGC
jgi:hypothetical protein